MEPCRASGSQKNASRKRSRSRIKENATSRSPANGGGLRLAVLRRAEEESWGGREPAPGPSLKGAPSCPRTAPHTLSCVSSELFTGEGIMRTSCRSHASHASPSELPCVLDRVPCRTARLGADNWSQLAAYSCSLSQAQHHGCQQPAQRCRARQRTPGRTEASCCYESAPRAAGERPTCRLFPLSPSGCEPAAALHVDRARLPVPGFRN